MGFKASSSFTIFSISACLSLLSSTARPKSKGAIASRSFFLWKLISEGEGRFFVIVVLVGVASGSDSFIEDGLRIFFERTRVGFVWKRCSVVIEAFDCCWEEENRGIGDKKAGWDDMMSMSLRWTSVGSMIERKTNAVPIS